MEEEDGGSGLEFWKWKKIVSISLDTNLTQHESE